MNIPANIPPALLRFFLRIRQVMIGAFKPTRTFSTDTGDGGGPTFFQSVLEHGLDFVTILDGNGIILYESPSVTRLLGYELPELIGKSIFDFIHPEDLPRVVGIFQEGIATPSFVGEIDCRFRHKNGSWKYLEAIGKNLLQNPVIGGIVVNSRDVTDRRRIEQENKMFAHTLESVRECVSITDMENTILYVNKAFLTTYGFEEGEVLGKNIAVVRSDRNPESIVKDIHPDTLKGAWEGEIINRKKDGTEFPIHLSTTLIKDQDGTAVALMGLARDITKRRSREQQERARIEKIFMQNQALQAIGRLDFNDLEAARQRILEIDAETLDVARVSIWSFIEKQKKIRCEDLYIGDGKWHETGLSFDAASYPGYFEALMSERVIAAEDARADPRTSEFLSTYLVPNGIMSKLDIPIVVGGTIVGILCHEQTGRNRRWNQEEQEFAASVSDRLALAMEAAERRAVEENLRSALSLLTATLEATTDGILVVNTEGKIVSYNSRFLKIWGIPLSVLATGRDEDALQYVTDKLKDPESFQQKVESLYRDPEAESSDVIEFKDGRMVERFSAPQRIEGRCVGRVWSFRDVTKRKYAEHGLRESERKYRALFTNVLDGVYRSTPDGKLLTANPAFVKMLGYTSEKELKEIDIGQDLYVDPLARERWRSVIEQKGTVRNTEVELRRKDGSHVVVLENSYAVKDEAGTILYYEGTATDISERTRAEQDLRSEKERYREFFMEDLTGDFISSPDGQLLDCNPAFARIFGFASVEEALEAHATTFYPRPEARQNLMQLLKRKKKLENVELEAKRRDGKPVYVIENMYGTFNEDGDLIQIKGYLFDNTERRRLEEEVRQAQKMESIGTLAGGIAHDFNNILAIIIAYASSAKRGADLEKMMKATEGILSAADRGAGLVRQLLTIARKASIEIERVNANDIITDLQKLLRETFPRTITFETELAQDLPDIIADRTQIHQVLLNLCVNARDAMEQGGSIHLSSANIDAAALPENMARGIANEYIRIMISDSGSGIDEVTLRRIFEPFFTTKSQEHGTGLGLAVVYGIVKAHNGHIHVESNPGLGTTFTIYFPVAETDSRDIIISREVEEIEEGGSEVILLVEDEKVLQSEIADVLRSKGYSVLTADDGLEAVDVFQANIKRIDLIIMDIGLPKLSGWDALKAIQQLDPTIRVMIASGYFSPDLKPEMMKAGIRTFVQKPYHIDKLLAEIRLVMT